MNKFTFSALLYEVYNEILFITYNYQKEKIDGKDIRKLSSADYKNLEKSKYLSEYYSEFTSMKPDEKYVFDDRFLKIMELKDYTEENLIYLIDYLNPYMDYYYECMEKIEKSLKDVLEIKEKSNGFEGNYPTYVKLTESNVKIERIVLSLNTKNYLKKTEKKLGYYITFMDYDVKLDNYKFNDTDLRGKTKEEIFKILDASMKVNLSDSKYYQTRIKEIDMTNEELELMSTGEASLYLDKREQSYGGLKEAMKGSLKQTLLTLGGIIVILIVVFLVKYFKK